MTTTNWANLAQMADDATKPIEAGTYPVKVSKAEAVTASTGSPMVKMICDVQGDPELANKRIYTQLVLTVDNGFALRRWFTALEAFGLTRDWLVSTDATIDMIAMALVGRYAQANVTVEPYKGQDRNKVDGWSPYDTPLQPVLPDANQLALATVSNGSPAAGDDEIVF